MSNLIPFDFEGTKVRTVAREGEPWFVLADVCRVLEISNPSQAAARLDEDEKSTLTTNEGGNFNGLRAVGAMPSIINESGLYSLVLTSRKAEAKRFKKWITGEVIPAIRKSGGYMVAAPEETEAELALRALTVLQATVERQKAQLAVVAPKAEAFDRIATADGSLNITEAAKALQVRPKDLFAFLQRKGWIYRRAGGASFLGYQDKTAAGLLEHKVTTVLRGDGTEKIAEQVRITPKGMAKLATLLQPPPPASPRPLRGRRRHGLARLHKRLAEGIRSAPHPPPPAAGQASREGWQPQPVSALLRHSGRGGSRRRGQTHDLCLSGLSCCVMVGRG